MDAEALYYGQDYQASYEAYDARLGEGGKHRRQIKCLQTIASLCDTLYGKSLLT